MVKVSRSRTLIDLYSWLYEIYCDSGLNDAAFNTFAVWAVNRAMSRRGIEGNFAEMRRAMDVFEFNLDPADPAYCSHMRHVFLRMQKAL